MGGLMSLQGAHRTSGETIHLVLLPSHQRTHQDMNTPSGVHAPLRTQAAPRGRPATFQLTLPLPAAQTRNRRTPSSSRWMGERFFLSWSCSTSLTARWVGVPPSHQDLGQAQAGMNLRQPVLSGASANYGIL